MKTFSLSGACAALLVAATASAQTTSPFVLAKCDPQTITFSNVRLPQPVLADGKPLAAGTYDVRIAAERPKPAVGQSPTAACWVEFVKGGAIAGKEVASVIPAEEIGAVAKGPAPQPNAVSVDVLKGGEYLRVWMNGGGTHFIVNMPLAR
jgi:hypothetical protein